MAGVERLTPRGVLCRRGAQPADRRAQGRRRSGAGAHALLSRPARAEAARAGRQGRGSLARRGYDLTEVFELVGLDIKMLYGGPKEAVMHSIYRQNLGFTDIVIGRKHADAPFADGKPIWGDFDAQEIFDNLRGDLRIRPCKIGFAAYFESAGRVELIEQHPGREAGRHLGLEDPRAAHRRRASRRAHPAPRDRRYPDRVLQREVESVGCTLCTDWWARRGCSRGLQPAGAGRGREGGEARPICRKCSRRLQPAGAGRWWAEPTLRWWGATTGGDYRPPTASSRRRPKTWVSSR